MLYVVWAVGGCEKNNFGGKFMRIIKKLWFTILFICLGALCLTACEVESVAQSITLNGYSAESPLELSIGKFPYADYTVSVTYDNGVTEELPLSEDMISETDKLRFYQAGKSEIAIQYKGAITLVTIEVFRNEFSESVQIRTQNASPGGKLSPIGSSEPIGD